MINEVQLARQTNELFDTYRMLYKTRYESDPVIFNAGVAGTILKDIIRLVGYDRASKLVIAYFKSNDDWYRKQGHSLECLKKNLAQLSSQIPDDKVVALRQPKNLRIMFWTVCPKCQADFEVTCWASEAEKVAHTKLCSKCLTEPPTAA
jgi:hypothetical protein